MSSLAITKIAAGAALSGSGRFDTDVT